jgi:membrane fusion protein, multidrug efflux system
VTRSLKRLLLLVVIPLIAAIGAGVVYLKGGRYVQTDNAYVKAEKVAISTEVSGRVHEVFVQENQVVTAGQPLFRLDPEPFQVAIAKAEARLAQVRTDFAALKASYRAKQAEITLATTRHAFAKRDQQRQADLVAKHFISAARFEESQQTADLAIQQINALEQDLHRIAETLGGSIDTPVEKHPTYRSALAELSKVKLDLAHTELRASLPGNVNKPPRLGQFVTAGSMAMALVVSGNVWIEANFTETDLTYMHPGQPVVIRIDTYPGVTWRGTVDSLSPATSAEFSVIPAQNATGNWVKVTQRVPVRIKLDADTNAPQLRAGLSAVVEIDTGHRRRLFGFAL